MAVCPIMSLRSSASKEAIVNCIESKCAFWDSIYNKCSQVSSSERLSEALEQLQMALNDMKARM